MEKRVETTVPHTPPTESAIVVIPEVKRTMMPAGKYLLELIPTATEPETYDGPAGEA